MSDTPAPNSAAVTDPDLSGRRFGDYRLLRRLGRGGMADVYLAEQESLHRRVAFKVLRSGLAQEVSYVRRFAHEAQAAAALVHANIVQIHEVGCVDGLHFIAQEYVDGQNLKQLLLRKGTLDAAATVHIFRQVAAALHKAEQQRITHRDIKPENIMLSSGGEVKVADFGLARIGRAGQSLDLTQVGMTLGTPLYMSPEQVEGRVVDTRSDIYSLGVTCYQMLAGRPPFEGDTPLNIAIQHLHKEPPRLEDLRPDLPSGLCRIIHKMLAKATRDRHQTAAQLLTELRGLAIAGLEEGWPSGMEDWTAPELQALTAAPTEATQQLAAVFQREASWRRRPHRGWRLAGVVFVAFLAGSVLAWATRPSPLLQVSEEELPKVEPQPTVREQYLYAASIGTQRAWESVERCFPAGQNEQNRYYALRAKQRLAELYLEHGDLSHAWECYAELADVDATQVQFQAIGLAGQANIHLLRGEKPLAKQSLVALLRVFEDLPPNLKRLFLTELDSRLRPEWDQLYREASPPKKPGTGSGPPKPSR